MKIFKFVLVVLVLLTFGLCLSCSKKAVRTEAVSYPSKESQKTSEAMAEEEAKAAAEKAAAMEAEKKLKEETLKEEAARTEAEKIRQQELQEKAMREEAAREAAEREKKIALVPIHFDFDNYTIRDDQKEALMGNAEWLKAHPQVRIRLEGNCDERGTAEYNLALGERRADTTKAFLEGLGVQKNRMLTISYGKERPLDPGHNEASWVKNRRVDFVPLK